jgi:CRP-like cAMP-binding protein
MEQKLWETALFRGISPTDCEGLLHCLHGVQKTYEKGTVIWSEGKPTAQIGLVLRGEVFISCTDVWGHQSILGRAQAGAVFGEAYACVPGEPLLICVTAAKETTVLFLEAGRILSPCDHACSFHTVLMKNLLTICAQKSLQLSRRILHTSPKSIRGKLLSYFSECAKKAGGDSFELPYNRQQLADYLSVDRSALCKELSAMQRDGLILSEKRRITILDAKDSGWF